MAQKDVYLERLARALDAHGELLFLERLSTEELAALWGVVARKALRQARFAPGVAARGA